MNVTLPTLTTSPDPHQPHTTPPLPPHEKVVRDDYGKTSPTCKVVQDESKPLDTVQCQVPTKKHISDHTFRMCEVCNNNIAPLQYS